MTVTDQLRSEPRHPREVLGLVLVLLVTLLACLPALRNGFAQDGKQLAMIEGNENAANPMVVQLGPITSYFRAHYWSGAGVESNLYRPITVLSFALVRRFVGEPLQDDALAHHLVDVLLHVLATALVWLLLRRLAVPSLSALLGTLVFGLHAIHAEAIASIVGRAEILGFLGGGLGTLCALHAARASGWRCAGRSVAAVLAFFVAFSAKESSLPWVVFAPLVLLVQVLRAGASPRNAWRPMIFAFSTAFLAAAAFLILRAQALAEVATLAREFHTVNPLIVADTMTRVATAVVVWGYALWKLVLPIDLVSDYGGSTFLLRTSLLDPAVVGCLLLIGGLVAVTLASVRRSPLAFLAGSAFLGFSFVVSNVPFAIGTVFAERLLYTPSLACVLLVAWIGQRAPKLLGWLCGAWLIGSTWILVARFGDWRDDATLHVRDALTNPKSTRLQAAAGEELYAKGDLRRAIQHTHRAVELDPEAGGAWNNLGSMLIDSGSNPEAEAALRSGLAARHRSDSDTRMLRLNLARALLAQKLPVPALAELEALLEDAPDFAPAVLVALEAAGAAGLDTRIVDLLAAGEKIAPRAAPWAYHRGLLALRQKDYVQAERDLRAVIQAGYEVNRAKAALESVLEQKGKSGR